MSGETITLGTLRAESRRAYGLWEGLRGDIAANLGQPGWGEGRWRIWLRAMVSPEIRLCLLLRLGARSSRWTAWIWRNALIALHGSEIQPGPIFAPGLKVPVPFGLAIGAIVETGRDVTLENRTSFALRTESGQISKRRTVIGDGARILANTTLMGGVQVGPGATVGPDCLVTHRVREGARTEPHSRH